MDANTTKFLEDTFRAGQIITPKHVQAAWMMIGEIERLQTLLAQVDTARKQWESTLEMFKELDSRRKAATEVKP